MSAAVEPLGAMNVEWNAMTREPAQVARLHHGKAFAPSRRSTAETFIKCAKALRDTSNLNDVFTFSSPPIIRKAVLLVIGARQGRVWRVVQVIRFGRGRKPQIRLITRNIVETLGSRGVC
jgi:hypothetical protein